MISIFIYRNFMPNNSKYLWNWIPSLKKLDKIISSLIINSKISISTITSQLNFKTQKYKPNILYFIGNNRNREEVLPPQSLFQNRIITSVKTIIKTTINLKSFKNTETYSLNIQLLKILIYCLLNNLILKTIHIPIMPDRKLLKK